MANLNILTQDFSSARLPTQGMMYPAVQRRWTLWHYQLAGYVGWCHMASRPIILSISDSAEGLNISQEMVLVHNNYNRIYKPLSVESYLKKDAPHNPMTDYHTPAVASYNPAVETRILSVLTAYYTSFECIYPKSYHPLETLIHRSNCIPNPVL
jgi:hypothetical protein